MNPQGPALASPCVRICAVDGASGLCVGCLRSLSEIAGWGGLDEAARTRILAELPGRRDRLPAGLRAVGAGPFTA